MRIIQDAVGNGRLNSPSVPPSGELDKTYAFYLILTQSLYYVKRDTLSKEKLTDR